jgi:hypothetical protein
MKLAEASIIVFDAAERGMPAPQREAERATLEHTWIKRGGCWIDYDPTCPMTLM